MRFVLASSTLALLASCSAPRHAPLERLAVVRAVHVDYHAEFGPSIARRASQKGEAAVPAPVPVPVEAACEPSIEMRFEFLHFDAAAEAELFGPGRVEGLIVAKQALAAARERCALVGLVERVGAPTLRVNDGQRAHLSRSNETAFVRAFTLSPATDALIFDPEVATVQEGYRLDALPRLAGGVDASEAPGAPGAIDLEFAIDANQLVRPVGEVSAPLPGFPNAVTLQIPIGFDQHIGGKLTLAPGEVLVVRGLVDRDGRTMLACIEAERRLPETAALEAR